MNTETPFTSLGLAEPLLRAIADAGYTTPTPIQAQAIPLVLAGTVRITVAIDYKGAIKNIKITEKTLPDPVADCMLKVVKAAPFPEAKKCPDCFRHWAQWQASGGSSSPDTVNRTLPQRHEPLCMLPS